MTFVPEGARALRETTFLLLITGDELPHLPVNTTFPETKMRRTILGFTIR